MTPPRRAKFFKWEQGTEQALHRVYRFPVLKFQITGAILSAKIVVTEARNPSFICFFVNNFLKLWESV